MIIAYPCVMDNAWIDFRIMADAGQADAYNYAGDDGNHYGGAIGADWNGIVATAYYGKAYQQGNPRIRLTILKSELSMRKTVDTTNAASGDILTYKIIIESIGEGTAIGVKITDAIPDGTSYVPGSLKITYDTNTNYAGATGQSDAEGDDMASRNGKQVTFCLKGGTAPDAGGTLGSGESVAAFFQVRIHTNYAGEYFTNTAYFTNTDADFDANIIEGGQIIANESLWAGDTVVGEVPCIYQSAINRDHTIGKTEKSGSWLKVTNNNVGWNVWHVWYVDPVPDEFATEIDLTTSSTLEVCLKKAGNPGNINWGAIKILVRGAFGNNYSANFVSFYGNPTAEWTKIKIPMTDFGGVNKARISGVGLRWEGGGGAHSIGFDEVRFLGANFLWYGDVHDSNPEDNTADQYIAQRYTSGGAVGSIDYYADNSDYLTIGNISGGTDARTFLSFSLAGINTNKNITSATLFLKTQQLFGTTTFYADQVIYSNIFDTTSDLASRYECNIAPRSVQQSSFASFSSGTLNVGDFYPLGCTDQVKWTMTNLMSWSDNGSKRIFQIRLRDNDGIVNEDKYVKFYAQNSAAAEDRPYLLIHYDINSYTNREVRAFTGFNLESIPENGNITSATLFLNSDKVEGQASEIEPILMDHIDYGSFIDSLDYDGCNVYSNAFNSFNTESGWMRFNIKDELDYAFNNPKSWVKDSSDKWFQIRLRPSTISTDYQTDKALFYSADETNKPYLFIVYETNTATAEPDAVTNISIVNGNNFDAQRATNIVNVSVATGEAMLSISKSISNITLGGINFRAIPGATIIYKIIYSNTSLNASSNAIIYDKLADNVVYRTNFFGTAAGWTVEYSTNTSPDQTWNSVDYTNVCPFPKNLIKWIRWCKPSVAANEDGKILFYKGLIK